MRKEAIVVYGAYGHTGRFVVEELRRREYLPTLSGRDAQKLNAMETGLELRPAPVGDPAALDSALAGAIAVINCAGPFALTAVPIIEAALRARVHYLDVAAEVEVAAATLEQYPERARAAGILIVPAMAFYGGLGDLLVTSAMSDWVEADEISLAFALSSWKPTAGTRATAQTSKQRRGGQRLAYSNRRLELRADTAPITEWTFPQPFGKQEVVAEFTTADCVTIPRHLRTRELRSYMLAAPLKDLSDPEPPAATDASGRSSQTFLVEAVARLGDEERRAVARGRDIYAITAPLVVEALDRVLGMQGTKCGIFTAGELSRAQDFLAALSPEPLSVEFSRSSST